MSNLEFRIGGRVVCINGDFTAYLREHALNAPHILKLQYPITGKTYTVRDFEDDRPNNIICLLLEEIVNPPHNWLGRISSSFREAGFPTVRFRPVRETSIDCFTALLGKPPVKQTEAA